MITKNSGLNVLMESDPLRNIYYIWKYMAHFKCKVVKFQTNNDFQNVSRGYKRQINHILYIAHISGRVTATTVAPLSSHGTTNLRTLLLRRIFQKALFVNPLVAVAYMPHWRVRSRSSNGLLPVGHQALAWTCLTCPIGPLWTKM